MKNLPPFREACALFLFFAVQAPSGLAQEAADTWKRLHQPLFNPARSASVKDLSFSRDRIRITLASGVIEFSHPVEGVIYAAVFRGSGRVQVDPPTDIEAKHLRLLTKKDSVDLPFGEAIFTFVDPLFLAEVSRQVEWASVAGSTTSDLYNARSQEREDLAAELVPRILKAIYSANPRRTAYFSMDAKTAEFGWVHFRYDTMNPEEVSVGRWTRPATAASRTAFFDSWLSFPAGDRAPGEAFHDPLAREDILIRSYRLHATVGDSEELRVTAQVRVEPKLSGEYVLLFELDANLRIESVKDEGGRALTFFQPRDPVRREQSYGDFVAVMLAEPTAAGRAQTLEFRYAGRRVISKMFSGIFYCQSYGWYPSRPVSFSTRADFEITFRSPKKYTLVATGTKVDETSDGDTTISTWRSDLPQSVAGFAFGDFKVVTQASGDINIQIFANRVQAGLNSSLVNPPLMAPEVANEIGNSVRLFEKYFGPYPFKNLYLTTIPYSYGQGWPGLIYLSIISFLSSAQRNFVGIDDHKWVTDFWRAHEVSHQWWGHRVSWKSYHDLWLCEGFAQFSGNLYVHMRQNLKEYLIRLREDRRDLFKRDQRGRVYESLGPLSLGWRLISAESPDAYQYIVYRKGGLVLNMLRMMLYDPANQQNPEQRFSAMMQEFTQSFHNRAASTEDFKAVAEKHMIPVMDVEGNRKLDWFFRQYVYGTGVANYSFRYTLQPDGNGVRVSGTITQSGVPEGWKDILPLYVHQGNSVALLGWTRVTQRESKVEFTLPVRPSKISLNYYEDILAEIRQ
jgi:hypothetical protein